MFEAKMCVLVACLLGRTSCSMDTLFRLMFMVLSCKLLPDNEFMIATLEVRCMSVGEHLRIM